MIDQLFNSSEKRLAGLLLLLANFGKEGRPEPIVGKFSQETLAEIDPHDPIAREFFMNKFRKLGFIEYNEKIDVHNVERDFARQSRDQIEGCEVFLLVSFIRNDRLRGMTRHELTPWEGVPVFGEVEVSDQSTIALCRIERSAQRLSAVLFKACRAKPRSK